MTAAEEAKPPLIVRAGDLPATAAELRDLLAADGNLYDRDTPVKLVQPAAGGPTIAMRLTLNNVVIEAHRICQPAKRDKDGRSFPTTLPERVARMYLDMIGEWKLPPLAGISTAPLLAPNGAIRDAVGYDPVTQFWCCKVPSLRVPELACCGDAGAALQLLRDAFKTFPFVDGRRRHDRALGLEVTDLAYSPGRDESAFLAGLLTAICRASLWLAPAFWQSRRRCQVPVPARDCW